jgi:hypothetical protein
MSFRPALISAFALAFLTFAPLSNADAATRYAAPAGDGPSPCLQSDPCDLETAVELGAGGLANGDTVLLAPGTYHPAGSVEVFARVTLSAEPGQPAPLIEAAGERGLMMWEPSTVRDIRIHSSAGIEYAFTLFSAESTAERVESTGEADRACELSGGTLRDVLCSATPVLGGGYGIEMFLASSSPASIEAKLFNVTTIGGQAGIALASNQMASVNLSATNTIASGNVEDVYANALAPTASVHADLSHSNFSEVTEEGVNTEVTPATTAGNQAAPPLFVDAAGGNFREAAGSPTRGAGEAAVVLSGETDLAGGARITDCAGISGVDIGAYQVQCPAPPTPPAPPRVVTSVPPKLSALTLTHKYFAATGTKAPKGTPHGTVIGYSLSEPATVTISILAKRAKHGKKSRLVTLEKLKASGKAGKNRFSFSGKLKGKPLSPGKYKFQIAAKDASGLSSNVLTLPFQIVS